MTGPNEINNDLVSDGIREVFRRYLDDKGVEVVKIEIKAGSVKGDNYLGIIAKAEVTGKDANGKPVNCSFIIKSAPKSEGLRKFAPIRLAYEREIYMYNYVLPAFNAFQVEKGIKNQFKSYAKCLKTSAEDGDEALIMTNMKDLGYELQNRKNALDYAHVKLVITELARYHSFSFALRTQKPELFEEFGRQMEKNYMTEMEMENFNTHVQLQCEKAQNTLKPDTDQEAIRRFVQFKADYSTEMVRILEDHCHPYSVVRHGDCWTNNVLFAYKDKSQPKTPTDLCFLDWQLSHIGPPVLDLLYFIYACTDKRIRSDYDELLRHYHETLKSFTAELGSDINELYPYEVMMDQFQAYGKYGLIIAIMLLHLLTSDSEEIPDINKIFESGDDAEAFAAFTFESKNIDSYNERVRDIILHMVEKNYI